MGRCGCTTRRAPRRCAWAATTLRALARTTSLPLAELLCTLKLLVSKSEATSTSAATSTLALATLRSTWADCRALPPTVSWTVPTAAAVTPTWVCSGTTSASATTTTAARVSATSRRATATRMLETSPTSPTLLVLATRRVLAGPTQSTPFFISRKGATWLQGAKRAFCVYIYHGEFLSR